MHQKTNAPGGTMLLGEEDPAPVEVSRPDGASTILLTCEHAGKLFPKRLGTLGLHGANLERHIAWDIGAAEVARRLSQRLDAPLVLQRYSRLVVDCNRWPTADDFITRFSEDTEIPGNLELSEAEAQARASEIFHPYHDHIKTLLDRRIASQTPTVLVSVHSCTPVFLGVSRPWHIGILYERDRRFAAILLRLLGDDAELCIGDNEPYFMTDEKDYAVPIHGEYRGLPHVELEIRQDLIATSAGQDEWAARLDRVLTAGVDRLRADGHL